MNSKNNLIYFNNNVVTKPDEVVFQQISSLEKMTPINSETYIQKARSQLCELINCEPYELIFSNSNASAIVFALLGIYKIQAQSGKHIITCKTEHPDVLKTFDSLKKLGAEITYLDVDREGLIDLEELNAAFRKDTILVAIMAANDETGVIQPLEKIAAICQSKNVLSFSDLSYYVGKIRCDVKELGIDYATFSADKMYGPDNIALIYLNKKNNGVLEEIKKSMSFDIPLPLIVGFGKAAELSSFNYWEDSSYISRLKNHFEHQLLDIEGLTINGSTRNRLYTTSNLTFPETKKVYTLLDKFHFTAYRDKSSYVLKAMGLSNEEINNSDCFSFGKYNTINEIDLIIKEIMNL